jgi:hypothetical protein
VIDTRDPEGLGRIRVAAPEISGAKVLGWALPCFPTNGSSRKTGSALPLEGATVWIEFERGDLSFPIWSGRFFTTPAETPASLRHR